MHAVIKVAIYTISYIRTYFMSIRYYHFVYILQYIVVRTCNTIIIIMHIYRWLEGYVLIDVANLFHTCWAAQQ